MAEHTPGPWTLRRSPAEDERAEVGAMVVTLHKGDTWAIDAADEWFELATIYTSGGEYEPQSEANARLLAAAPDLLAACKVALLGGAQDFDVAEERRAIVRAAIDKAEGR